MIDAAGKAANVRKAAPGSLLQVLQWQWTSTLGRVERSPIRAGSDVRVLIPEVPDVLLCFLFFVFCFLLVLN